MRPAGAQGKPGRVGWLLLALLVSSGPTEPALARSDVAPSRPVVPSSSMAPNYCASTHDVGRLVMAVGNNGTIGTGLLLGSARDCFTGFNMPSCQYPRGTSSGYLWAGALWVGAVVGEDTLVSTGEDAQLATSYEFHPDAGETGGLIYRSLVDPASPYYAGAISEQDFVAVAFDTCRTCSGIQADPVDARPHRPLGIRVTQASYAWSYPQTEDIVFFDFEVTNIGDDYLKAVYFGVYIDADIHALDGSASLGYTDDHAGFLETAPHPSLPETCASDLEVNLAWTVDDEGDFAGVGPRPVVPCAVAICPLALPNDSARVAFNWWNRDVTELRDFGPQARSSFRLMATGEQGTPMGDRDKYHILSNGEIDYAQARIAEIGGGHPTWLPPPPEVTAIALGVDTRFAVSVGPVDLEPGESAYYPMAMVVGEDFHTIPGNQVNLPASPETYFSQVDFGDLVLNRVTAQNVYDNPGVDTDGDGYAGEPIMCGEDTVWYLGDGVPDWRAVNPPPPPEVWIEPTHQGARVRFNGAASETALRWISQQGAFEGYHIYLGLDNNLPSYALVGAYDVEDYLRYAWDTAASDWTMVERRVGLDEAVCRYAPNGCGDPSWHPLDFPRSAPFVMPDHPDSVFYFDRVGVNASIFGVETPITKRYPHAPRPDYRSPEAVPPDSVTTYLTDDGYFKFYEYEYELTGLLPGHEYWLSVTAFDYGSNLIEAAFLESEITTSTRAFTTLYSDPACCVGTVGNVDGDPGDRIDLADLARLVDYLFISGQAPDCYPEADIDGSGFDRPGPESISLVDLALLVDYIFIGDRSLAECR